VIGAEHVWAAATGHGTSKYLAGMQPYFDVLKNLQLPPRGKRGSAVNRRRARMVQQALKAKKRELARLKKEGKRNATS